jgi:hypothetical protein
MLLEVLESVIFLEIFPFGKWHYTERRNADILVFIPTAQKRHCLEGCFPLECPRFAIFKRVDDTFLWTGLIWLRIGTSGWLF